MTATPPAPAPGPTATYRDFYEYEADVYAIGEESEPAWRFRRLLVDRLLPKEPLARVLDAGCGDAALAHHVGSSTGAHVTGMDLSVRRMARARARGVPVPVLQGSIYDLPFPDGRFDLVVCSDLLEHLDAPGAAMRELVRVSRRWVVVTVPNRIDIEKTLCPHCGRDYFLYGHQHSFGRDGLTRLAQDAGARIDAFEHVIPMFECRRYKLFPPLKWLIWDHFKDSGTLGARIRVGA